MNGVHKPDRPRRELVLARMQAVHCSLFIVHGLPFAGEFW